MFEDAAPSLGTASAADPEAATISPDSSRDRAAPEAAGIVLGAEATTLQVPSRRRIAVRPPSERDQLKAHVFKAGQRPPLRVARRLVWRPNDFPYWFEDDVRHDVLWVSRSPLNDC